MSIARRNLAHLAAGTQDQAEGVVEVPVANYVDHDRWTTEMERVFARLPLIVAASAELREPHSYIAGDGARK